MPKVTEAHREQMRTRIRQAALAVFERRGVQGSGMAEIISEAGLSAGAVYGYFRSKDALTAEVAGDLITGRFDRLHQLAEQTPTPPPHVAIRELLDTMPPMLFDSGLVLEIWSMAARDHQLRVHGRAALDVMVDAFSSYLEAYLVQEGVAAGSAQQRAAQLAPALAGLCQGYIVQRGLVGEAAAEPYFEALAAINFLTA